jgi:hypothetical protein
LLQKDENTGMMKLTGEFLQIFLTPEQKFTIQIITNVSRKEGPNRIADWAYSGRLGWAASL